MKNYLNLLNKILTEGEETQDRTGTGTLSLFGEHLTFDLREKFPAVTTKTLAWNPCRAELKWFLEGSTNVERLRNLTHGVGVQKWCIWDPNYNDQAVNMGYENGELGPVYGKQWRNFGGVDQIAVLIDSLTSDPKSRRHIVSAWNVGELSQMALPPCHMMMQFHVNNRGELSCHMYQRSVDSFLGLPFNIASYALLTHILAEICDYTVGDLHMSFGDVHIYTDHIDQCLDQVNRKPLELPTLLMPRFDTLDQFFSTDLSDFVLEGYESLGVLKGKMSS